MLKALALLILLSSFVPAQTAPALPTFPLPAGPPRHVTWAQRDWTPAMKRYIQQTYRCTRCSAINVYRVDLGALNPAALIDVPDSPCEAQAGECSHFSVVFSYKKRLQADDLTGNGWATVVPHPGGVPDLLTGDDYPCCSGTASRYSFLDGHFKLSGCDQIAFDSFGDFKNADVTPCT